MIGGIELNIHKCVSLRQTVQKGMYFKTTRKIKCS